VESLRATRREEPQVGGLTLPRFIAGHEILDEIGRGGMGVVYRARQVALQRIVALKLIPSPQARQEDLARFWAEAKSVARLSHPHIVPIFEMGEHDGLPFYTMEYLSEGNLEQYLERQHFTPTEAATLIEQLAQAVQHAHDQGILHRDLKPANVLLSPAKIADFGLARQLDGSGHHTRTGAILGTPAYMAPEQAAGRRDQGPGVDIWSLGAMLYECLTGRLPFQGQSILHTLEMVRREDPIPPSRIDGRIPRDLENIVLRCLEKDPARRYASAADLAADLRRWLAGDPVQARPVSRWTTAWRWAKRRPALAGLMGGLAALALLVAAAVPYHILRLEIGVRHAQAQATAAHEKARRAELQTSVEREISQARQEVKDGQFAQAAQRFQSVVDRIREEPHPDLQQLCQTAATLHEHARTQARQFPEMQRTQERLVAFLSRRDQAIFAMYAGLLIDTSLDDPVAARQAITQALAVCPDPDTLPEGLAPAEGVRIREARIELRFLLADLDARENPRQGLQHLDGLTGLRGVHLRRARYLDALGQHAAATLERQQAQATSDYAALDGFLAAQEAMVRGDLTTARRELDRALIRQPDLYWGHFLQASVQLRLRNPTEALISLGACIQRRPQEVWPYLLRAGVRLSLGQLDEASRDLDQAGGLQLNTLQRYSLLVHRGVLALARRDPKAALEPLEQARALLPDHPAVHANQAEVYWQQGKKDRALECLSMAIDCTTEPAALLRKRARWHSGQGKLTAALDDLTAIRQPQPDDLAEQARLYYSLRRYREAVEATHRALREQPLQKTALRVQAESLLELQRPREAWAAFNRYLRQHRDADAYARRARARGACNDLPGVIEDYTQALALREDAAFRCGRGWAYLIQNAPELAQKDFERAVVALPTEAHLGLASAKLAQGRNKEALADTQTALRKPPTQHRLLYAAARVLARTTAQPATSLKWLEAALEALPPGQRSKFWRERVQKDEAFVTLRTSPGYRKLQALHDRDR
jgi:tetratricopeptide (TPR) repeat protein